MRSSNDFVRYYAYVVEVRSAVKCGPTIDKIDVKWVEIEREPLTEAELKGVCAVLDETKYYYLRYVYL